MCLTGRLNSALLCTTENTKMWKFYVICPSLVELVHSLLIMMSHLVHYSNSSQSIPPLEISHKQCEEAHNKHITKTCFLAV